MYDGILGGSLDRLLRCQVFLRTSLISHQVLGSRGRPRMGPLVDSSLKWILADTDMIISRSCTRSLIISLRFSISSLAVYLCGSTRFPPRCSEGLEIGRQGCRGSLRQDGRSARVAGRPPPPNHHIPSSFQKKKVASEEKIDTASRRDYAACKTLDLRHCNWHISPKGGITNECEAPVFESPAGVSPPTAARPPRHCRLLLSPEWHRCPSLASSVPALSVLCSRRGRTSS